MKFLNIEQFIWSVALISVIFSKCLFYYVNKKKTIKKRFWTSKSEISTSTFPQNLMIGAPALHLQDKYSYLNHPSFFIRLQNVKAS